MNDLATLAAEIKTARDDIATLERLTGAKARLAQLEKDHAAAQAIADREAARAAKEAEKARFAGLSDIRVETRCGQHTDNVVWNRYIIHWTAPKWDMYAQASPLTPVLCHGFNALDRQVFAFLIERHPEQIPAEIMELAPGDPYKAFERYFVALKRGYTTGGAAQ